MAKEQPQSCQNDKPRPVGRPKRYNDETLLQIWLYVRAGLNLTKLNVSKFCQRNCYTIVIPKIQHKEQRRLLKARKAYKRKSLLFNEEQFKEISPICGKKINGATLRRVYTEADSIFSPILSGCIGDQRSPISLALQKMLDDETLSLFKRSQFH